MVCQALLHTQAGMHGDGHPGGGMIMGIGAGMVVGMGISVGVGM